MQDEKVQDKHREWLRKHLGIEYEDIYDMDDDDIDWLSCRLMEAEVDADGTDDEPLIQEIIEIIYGPFVNV